MNSWTGMGRLTRDPDVSRKGDMSYARFGIAVNRRFKRENEPDADFLNCVAFGKQAEFVEKFLKKGTKIAIRGRLQSSSYTNKEGNKVTAIDVIAEEIEFAESKNASTAAPTNAAGQSIPPQMPPTTRQTAQNGAQTPQVQNYATQAQNAVFGANNAPQGYPQQYQQYQQMPQQAPQQQYQQAPQQTQDFMYIPPESGDTLPFD